MGPSSQASDDSAAAAAELLMLEWDHAAMVDRSYHPLPPLYLGFLAAWSLFALAWAVNTWSNRHYQLSKLQWMLALVPLIKALQLGSSYLFWNSCINLRVCSLWMSFGSYVAGILFQTTAFVSFMTISHGYCIICEQLSVSERRTTASLGFILYLTLIGNRAALPYFTVILMFNYFTSFCVIFRHISRNLVTLREQLLFVGGGDHGTHGDIERKYTMLKKFKIAMQIVAMTEVVVHVNLDVATDDYWFRLFVREWAQLCIFLYIGWTFRSQAVPTSFFQVPASKLEAETKIPPVYTIEMDAKDYKQLSSQTWQIGVPTSVPFDDHQKSADTLLIIIQNPHATCRSPQSMK